jgi:hypothetical protein
MAQTVTRLYDTTKTLAALEADLKQAGFKYSVITAAPSGRTADDLVKAIAATGVTESEAQAYADAVKKGGAVVAVEAEFGFGTNVGKLLNRHGPSQISVPPRKYYSLLDEPALFSSMFNIPVLLDNSAPYKGVSGTPLLTDQKNGYKSFSGLPLLANTTGPYKSTSGLPLVIKSNGPYKGASGAPLLLKDKGPYKSYSGLPLLLDNPTPFSSWLGLPVLWK